MGDGGVLSSPCDAQGKGKTPDLRHKGGRTNALIPVFARGPVRVVYLDNTDLARIIRLAAQ